MTTKKRGPGRPPKPATERQTTHLDLRLTVDARATYQRAADALGMRLADWARLALNAAACPRPMRPRSISEK